MTDEDPSKYNLHLAVWDDNIDMLQYLLLQPSIVSSLETTDPQGNTPLLLAYRLGRTKAARMLLVTGAFSKARSPEGWEAVQIAGLSGNPDLIRTAVVEFLKETDNAFERRLPSLQTALGSIPDFTLRMSWEFSTWVPLLGNLLPSDTYSIHKRGTSLRLDTTLLGMNGLRWERGSVSLLLWGNDMPIPGAMYVLDNELKTAANARLAFTHPQDTHIQDWVRKLLTQKQKATDYWSRDTVLVPMYKTNLLSGLFGKVKSLAIGDDTPRGRISQNDGSTGNNNEEEGGGNGGNSSVPSSPVVTLAPNGKQLYEDVGIWSNCAVFEMKNLCVRDLTHPPLLNELKLTDWWKAEYSQQYTDEQAIKAENSLHQQQQQQANSSSNNSTKSNSSSSSSSSSGTSTLPNEPKLGIVAESEAPEKLLKPLHSLLKAIRLGKINESNAATTTSIEQVEGLMDDNDDWGSKRSSSSGSNGSTNSNNTNINPTRIYTFEEYFGFERPAPSLDQFLNPSSSSSSAATKKHTPSKKSRTHHHRKPRTHSHSSIDSYSSSEENDPTHHSHPHHHYAHTDGRLHKPTARMAVFKEENITQDDKSLDVKVYFAKDFPLTTEQFLPIAEVMARTGRHAANIRRFFSSKMPSNAGFPVRFTLPVFPAITATITFDFCDPYRSPQKSLFVVPSDYKMGAYIERGFIRQL